MKLTKKQKNCPYCHPGSKVNGRECWYHTTLALGEAIDSCTYTELYFNPVNRFLEASCEDELFIDINYCPHVWSPTERGGRMMQMPNDNEFYEKRRKDWDTLIRLGYDHSNQADCWYPVGINDYDAPRMTEEQARALAQMIQKLEEE